MTSTDEGTELTERLQNLVEMRARKRMMLERNDLRDDFAMAALPALIALYDESDECTMEDIAIATYEYADAMLEARGVSEEDADASAP